jgi:hypothetical protein
MHPKSLEDLELDEASLKKSTEAAKWFKSTLQEVFDECKKADDYYKNLNCT